MICVVLPFHLQGLAGCGREVLLEVEGPVTQRSILDALEAKYPVLSGATRDHATQERRAYVRFFACGEDVSHEPMDAALPGAIADGSEKFRIIGALAGG